MAPSIANIARFTLFIGMAVASVRAALCESPSIRREWRELSFRERAEWIKAVNCLSAEPHDPNLVVTQPANVTLIPPIDPNSSYYDDLVYLHMDLNPAVHFTGMFLPWHRYFVKHFENSLRDKCGYEGVTPYWDWTLDSFDTEHSTMFDGGERCGLGGWGDPNDDIQITTGGFKDIVRVYPSPHRIRRSYTLQPLANIPNPFPNDPLAPPVDPTILINGSFTQTNYDFLLNGFLGDFRGFQAYLEGPRGTHGGPHLIMGGDMTGFCPGGTGPPDCYAGPKWTPNDPMFFLHHAMIDRLWAQWQLVAPQNALSFTGGSVPARETYAIYQTFPNGGPPFLNFESVLPSDGLWENVTAFDVMDTRNEILCYTYE